jgi:hypothetical protein
MRGSPSNIRFTKPPESLQCSTCAGEMPIIRDGPMQGTILVSEIPEPLYDDCYSPQERSA